MKRRDFLQSSAAVLAVGVLPSCGEGGSCSEAELVSVAADGDSARLPLADLDGAGGSLRLSVEGRADKIILARTDSDGLVAVTWVCTHASCTVCFEPDAQEFVCPCHGARFDSGGAVVSGPASSPLKKYSARIDGDQVVVHLA